jgi:hypothetical protein
LVTIPNLKSFSRENSSADRISAPVLTGAAAEEKGVQRTITRTRTAILRYTKSHLFEMKALKKQGYSNSSGSGSII